MNRYRMDTWRTARMNQHMHRALATRYQRLDLWSSLAVAVLGSGSVMSVVGTDGNAWAMAAALICAILIAVRPLANWSTMAAERHAAWLAWRHVEELCEDGAEDTDLRDAERQAHRLDPQSSPHGLHALREWAFSLTNEELPLSRFA